MKRSTRRAHWLGHVALACAFATLVGASAATSELRAPGGTYTLRLTSLKEARFKTTLPQQYDFSCGSAATATLLTHQYGHPVSEVDVFVQMYNNGDQARIRIAGLGEVGRRAVDQWNPAAELAQDPQ